MNSLLFLDKGGIIMQEKILTIECTPHTYFQKALSSAHEGAIEEALQCIDAAIVFSNNSSFYIYQKMKLLFDLGAYEICTQFIAMQLEHLFKNASLYLVCRFIDYYQKINQADLTHLQKFLEAKHVPFCLATEYKDLLYHPHKSLLPLAKKASVQDHHTLCISYCDLITKTPEFTSNAVYLKAYSYHMLGNLTKARLCYLELIALEPDSALAHNNLGLVFMEEGLYKDALNVLQKAVSLAPTHKEYLMHLAECHCRCKQYGEAAKIYEGLHKAFPDDLQPYFDLSYTYRKYNKKFLCHKYTQKVKKKLKIHHHVEKD